MTGEDNDHLRGARSSWLSCRPAAMRTTRSAAPRARIQPALGVTEERPSGVEEEAQAHLVAHEKRPARRVVERLPQQGWSVAS